jgi:hypothetical protein
MAWEVRGSPDQRIKHHVIVARDTTVSQSRDTTVPQSRDTTVPHSRDTTVSQSRDTTVSQSEEVVESSADTQSTPLGYHGKDSKKPTLPTNSIANGLSGAFNKQTQESSSNSGTEGVITLVATEPGSVQQSPRKRPLDPAKVPAKNLESFNEEEILNEDYYL